MSVRACVFPWDWAVVTVDSDVMLCSHGSAPIGNLARQTFAEIWNGTQAQEVRAAILRNEVHPICQSTACPYQHAEAAFPKGEPALEIDEETAAAFDDAWYLETNPDAAHAVRKKNFASGLEHFIRHGRSEGREYRLKRQISPISNSILALIEYSRGAHVIRSLPSTLVVAVSTLCNLRCVMCPHGMNLVERPRHMPLETVEIIGAALQVASRLLVSGLGEPTASPAFWRVLELTAHRTDLYLHVNSNGHLVTPARAERLLDSGISEISFSLDAATEETYRNIRGGDFHRAQEGISNLLTARARRGAHSLTICINLTLMQENLDEAPAFVELGQKLGVDAIIMTQLFAFGDRPDWQVTRSDGWRFVYSEQMPTKHPQETGHFLRAAQLRAQSVGIPLLLQTNTASYLAEADGASTSALS